MAEKGIESLIIITVTTTTATIINIFSYFQREKKNPLAFLLTLSLSSLRNDVSAQKKKGGRLFCHKQGYSKAWGGINPGGWRS